MIKKIATASIQMHHIPKLNLMAFAFVAICIETSPAYSEPIYLLHALDVQPPLYARAINGNISEQDVNDYYYKLKPETNSLSSQNIGLTYGQRHGIRTDVEIYTTRTNWKSQHIFSRYYSFGFASAQIIYSRDQIIRNISIETLTFSLIKMGLSFTESPDPIYLLMVAAGGELGCSIQKTDLYINNSWHPFISRGLAHSVGPGIRINFTKASISSEILWTSDDFVELPDREFIYRISILRPI